MRSPAELEDRDRVPYVHLPHPQVAPERRHGPKVLHVPDHMPHPQRGALVLLHALSHPVLRFATDLASLCLRDLGNESPRVRGVVPPLAAPALADEPCFERCRPDLRVLETKPVE